MLDCPSPTYLLNVVYIGFVDFRFSVVFFRDRESTRFMLDC